MNKLERVSGGGRAIVKFNPKQTRMKLGALNEGVKLAAKIKDWDALENAIEAVIDEQRAFTAWWTAKVTPGRGGKEAQAIVATRQQLVSVPEATKQTGITAPQVSKWRTRLEDESSYRELLRERAYVPMWAREGNQRTKGTGETEWYTPLKYIEMARKVLGAIDLDPASSVAAQKTVDAKKFFTIKDDELKQEWHGRVWLNPPYSQPDIADFVVKLLDEIEINHVAAAIMLTHNTTDTAWFHDAAARADAICFTRGRIGYVNSDGDLAAATNGQSFFYFGSNREKFIAEYAGISFVVVRP